MTRIDREKETVEQMISIFCHHNAHHKEQLCNKQSTNKLSSIATGGNNLCPECRSLLEYARLRLSKCPFGEHKTTCLNCKIHCYKPDMKARIAEVMRFSGPRMILYHPIAALRHLFFK